MPGLRYKAPFITTVEHVVVRPQTDVLGAVHLWFFDQLNKL